jgi:[ribosomal protein S18]-alanine N-acetyltransferase
MISGADLQVRPAVLTDQRQIANLIHFSSHVHRHLDWRQPLDWIGSPPFSVIESQGQVVAALGCPPDPPSVAWMRLFVNSGKLPVQESWQMLWDSARTELVHEDQCVAAAIVLQEWLHDLLLSSGFASHQSIVMLERDGGVPAEMTLSPEISMRAMMPFDLPAVAEADASAFELLWQNALPALERAYPQTVWATVAETDGQVIGYQLSTRNPLGVHLARLAVRPAAQGKGLGYALVANLIQQARQRGISHLTVNTQSDNTASLALYQRMGFREAGERYPVYQLQVS